jgi:hypothetical protein
MGLLLDAQIRIRIGGHVMDSGRIECGMHVFLIATAISRLIHLYVAYSSHCAKEQLAVAKVSVLRSAVE